MVITINTDRQAKKLKFRPFFKKFWGIFFCLPNRTKKFNGPIKSGKLVIVGVKIIVTYWKFYRSLKAQRFGDRSHTNCCGNLMAVIVIKSKNCATQNWLMELDYRWPNKPLNYFHQLQKASKFPLQIITYLNNFNMWSAFLWFWLQLFNSEHLIL